MPSQDADAVFPYLKLAIPVPAPTAEWTGVFYHYCKLRPASGSTRGPYSFGTLPESRGNRGVLPLVNSVGAEDSLHHKMSGIPSLFLPRDGKSDAK
jgi:hypothetical protein